MALNPNEAKAIYWAFASRLIDRDAVISWADQWMSQIESPPDALIDLSLSRNVDENDILSALGILATGSSANASGKRILEMLCDAWESKRISTEMALLILRDLSCGLGFGDKAASIANEVEDRMALEWMNYSTEQAIAWVRSESKMLTK